MKTHPLSVTHLVVGLVFLGIAGSWALHQTGVIDGNDFTWLFPMALVVAGGVGLVAAMAKGVTGRRETTSYTDPAEPTGDYTFAYDPPLIQDYTSDLDRKLSESASPSDTTMVIRTEADTEPRDTAEHDTAEHDTDTDNANDKGDHR